MNRLVALLMVVIFFSACSAVRLNYYGRNSTPTHTVDMYLYGRDISTSYKVLGRAEVKTSPFVLITSQKVKNILMAKAKEIGADAIVLYDERQTPQLPTINTTTAHNRRVDVFGDSVTTKTSTISAKAPMPVFSPVFIKYVPTR